MIDKHPEIYIIQFFKNGLLRSARKDAGVWIASLRSQRRGGMDCFAPLAKTRGYGLLRSARKDAGASSYFLIKFTTKQDVHN